MTQPIVPLQIVVRQAQTYEFGTTRYLLKETVYAICSDNRIRLSFRTDEDEFSNWKLLPPMEPAE
jgi:hypothetical protein